MSDAPNFDVADKVSILIAVDVLKTQNMALKALAKRLARALDGLYNYDEMFPSQETVESAASALSAAREMLGEFDE